MENTNVESNNTETKLNRIPDEIGRMVFPPGVSGNPNGRPKGAKNFTTKVREALETLSEGTGTSKEKMLINKIMEKAIVEGNEQMIKLMWNYLDGMPQNYTDITTGGEKINYVITDGESK